MNKRIVFRIVLICTGIFIIILSAGFYILSMNYRLDTEKRCNVLVAVTDIGPGDILNDSMFATRTIRESAYNKYMLADTGMASGRKALYGIEEGDYIRSYDLLQKEKWHTDSQKTIILPMDIEERLANIIRKGSLVDIRVLLKDGLNLPQTVLAKVRIEDVLDENGVGLGDTNNSKKAYAVVVLDAKQRERIYAAQQVGKLVYEAYCDGTQLSAKEDFVIPEAFNEKYVSSGQINPQAGDQTDNAWVDTTKASRGGGE